MVATGWRRLLPQPRHVIACAAAALLTILLPPATQAQNLSINELKLGVLAHDAHFLGGKEHGIDGNPEVVFQSPFSDAWAASLPWYIRFAVQPRPTLGGEFNSGRYTNQYYFGATWTWQLASHILKPDDGITFSIFWGPSFNDGHLQSSKPYFKSLGSNVLFREAFEVGYRITPTIQISAFLDHTSNAGLAKQNQSINDVGGRIGFRF